MPPPRDAEEWRPVYLTDSGYVRYIDLERIAEFAGRYQMRFVLLRRVGEFIPQGLPIARVDHADPTCFDEHIQALLAACIEIGPTRTLQQDIEFGILQIVDIALKAISPAVNDPSTAVTCVDQLSRILILLLQRDACQSTICDAKGEPCVWACWPDAARLMDTAFTQIRQYARGDFAVSMRLLKVLGDLMHVTQKASHWTLLYQHGERIREGCRGRMASYDWQVLDDRWRQLCAPWPSITLRANRNRRWEEPSD